MSYKQDLIRWARRRQTIRRLRDEQDKSFGEIGKKYDVSPQQARTLYLRAKEDFEKNNGNEPSTDQARIT